eukprot:980392-Pyramimonas_sp.AAC.1
MQAELAGASRNGQIHILFGEHLGNHSDRDPSVSVPNQLGEEMCDEPPEVDQWPDEEGGPWASGVIFVTSQAETSHRPSASLRLVT